MPKTVLVVDDSPTMRQMVAFALSSAGYQVVEAGNGKEAVGKGMAARSRILSSLT